MIFYTIVSVGGCARASIWGTSYGLGDFGRGISGLHDELATVCLLFYRDTSYKIDIYGNGNMSKYQKCNYTLAVIVHIDIV